MIAPADLLRFCHPACTSAAAAFGLCLFAAASASPGGTTVAPPLPHRALSAAVAPASPATTTTTAPVVETLRFDEFFQQPYGPRGLEFSDKLRALNGQRVRLTGHMVNHLHADPRVFLLAPVPLKFHQCEYGLCDDLPATAVHVHVPGNPHDRVAFTPGPVTVTGRLSVGNVEELDGRISTVRLFLDPGQAAAMRTVAASAGTVR